MIAPGGEANQLTVRLVSGGTLTLSCSNLFVLEDYDRNFVLSLLVKLREYQASNPPEGSP